MCLLAQYGQSAAMLPANPDSVTVLELRVTRMTGKRHSQGSGYRNQGTGEGPNPA